MRTPARLARGEEEGGRKEMGTDTGGQVRERQKGRRARAKGNGDSQRGRHRQRETEREGDKPRRHADQRTDQRTRDGGPKDYPGPAIQKSKMELGACPSLGEVTCWRKETPRAGAELWGNGASQT